MSRVYHDKMSYIEKIKECMSAKDDFGNLTYHRNSKGNEFIVLADIIGQIGMLDVTGMCEAEILHCIAQIECGIVPNNYITDKAKRLEIARMIR